MAAIDINSRPQELSAPSQILQGRRPQDRRRRVRRAGRPVGLRQVDPAAPDRRAGGASTAGEIRIGGRVVNDLPPKDRDIAMVFQSYALYPHMTCARQHELQPASCKKTPREAIAEAVAKAGGQARPRRAAGAQAAPALRRPAPARRHGPRHRARAEGLPVRRAAVEPRRQAARADALRDQEAAPATSAPPRSTSRTTRSRR